MELKNGTIGKVVIKKANPVDPAKTTQEELSVRLSFIG